MPTVEEIARAVRESGWVSVSWLRGRFGMTAGEAVKAIDRLEADGLVGPPMNAGTRIVLTGNDRIGANMGRPKGSKNKAKGVMPTETLQAATPEQPKQAPQVQRLPGMENAGIPELEVIAEALYKVRKDRIALSKREGELSDDLLKMMKHFSKVEYHHEQVHAWREVTEEKVKVTIGELNAAKEKQIKDAVKGHIENQSASPDVPEEVTKAEADSPKLDAEDDLPEDLEEFEEEMQEELK